MEERTCSIEGCGGGGVLRRGWCQKHYKRWRRHGDPLTVMYLRRAPRANGHITYPWMHTKIRRTRGTASTFSCEHCGGQAKQWAYDHTDPNEVTQSWGSSTVTFSLDMGKYLPLCTPCHRAFDLAFTRAGA